MTLQTRSVASPVDWGFAFVVLILGFFADIPYLQTDQGWAALYVLGGCLFLVRGVYIHTSRNFGNLALAAFMVLAGLSIFWSPLPTQSFRSMVSLAGTTLLAAYLARIFATRDLLKLLFVALTFVAIASTVEEVAGRGPSGLIDPASPEGWAGILLHKNELGLSMVLLVGLATICVRWAVVSRGLGISVIALAMYLVYRSDAQAAWASAPILLLLALSLPTIRRTAKGFVPLLLLAFTPFFAWSLPFLEGFLLEISNDPDALTGRAGFWTEIVQAIGQQPVLGYGYRGFWNGLGEPSRSVALVNPFFAIAHAHNMYLEVALSLGLIGVGLFFVFFASYFLRSWRLAVGMPGPETHFFFVVACLILLYGFVEVIVPNFQSTHWMLLVALALKSENVLMHTQVSAKQNAPDQRHLPKAGKPLKAR